jgi:hypothetical protein
LRDGALSSVRKLAQATGIPKSSVDRHRQALQKRSVVAEAELWEQALGQEWLRRLVFAIIYVFGIKGGIGADRLSEFFHCVHLERHVGCSPSALNRLRTEFETTLLSYPPEQLHSLTVVERKIEICAGADETFFDQPILVLMDLVSGYMVLEEPAANRSYATWYERAQQALKPLGLSLRYIVSDRAKALIKLAMEGFSCPSIPDWFHMMRDLNKAMRVSFHLKLARIEEKRLQSEQQLQRLQAKGKGAYLEQRLLEHLTAQAATLRADQKTYQSLLHQATQAVHPFVLTDSRAQSSGEVETALHQVVAKLDNLRTNYTSRNNEPEIAKFMRQIPALAALVDLWWQWLKQDPVLQSAEPSLQHWVLARCLPAVYWQQQLSKTSTAALKVAYQQAFNNAQQQLQRSPMVATLTPPALEHWQRWAGDWVSKFQRASSPVEGRNGCLSQFNHCARGTPAQRLKVMTVIHNFDLQRADGTTAAERLFGSSFPNLFEWAIERSRPLPLPRKSRARSNPKPLILQNVPA